ncbi:MAG: hypothetical protein ACTSR0_04540 [Candidatus Asgardarchaeia archaeon]
MEEKKAKEIEEKTKTEKGKVKIRNRILDFYGSLYFLNFDDDFSCRCE